jgi:CubicO group peptidase (beta-lactamase class C family)
MKDVAGEDPYSAYNADEMWRFLSTWKAERERDVKWEYSNLGYGLLGQALALRAKRGFDSLLQERVLEPLGLQKMALALRGKNIAGLKRGHNAQREPVSNWDFDAMAGAGALTGSARDLARYAQAAMGVFDHPLKEAFALATKRHADGPAPINPFGLGWLIAPLDGRQLVTHDGGTGGFSSSMFIDPTRRRAALVLANAQVVVNDLALHALESRVPVRDVAAEKSQALRQTQREHQALTTEQLALLPGVYALNAQFKVGVRLKDGKLTAQATGQGEFELFALDARKFFAKITPLEIHFEGESGVPAAFVLHQGGQKLRFVRE